MNKTKRAAPMRRLPFLALWTVSVLVVSMASLLTIFLVNSALNLTTDNQTERAMTNTLISTAAITLIEIIMVERGLKRSMRGWSLYTAAGLMMTWVLYITLPAALIWVFSNFSTTRISDVGSALMNTLVATVLFVIPVAAFQGLWLRRQVAHSWLWPLTLISLGLISNGITYGGLLISSMKSYDIAPVMISGLAYALMTGSVLYYLMTGSSQVDKVKSGSVADGEDRSTRLEDENASQRTESVWDQSQDDPEIRLRR